MTQRARMQKAKEQGSYQQITEIQGGFSCNMLNHHKEENAVAIIFTTSYCHPIMLEIKPVNTA